MRKLILIIFISLLWSVSVLACNYSDGIIASFSKEHKLCSSYASNKAKKLNLKEDWERWDLYHDCRCDLYMADLRKELGKAMTKYERWLKR